MSSKNSMIRAAQPSPPSALQRLAILEGRFRNMVQQTENILNSQQDKITQLTTVLNAAVKILGVDIIEAKVKEDTIARLEAEADAEGQMVEDQVKAGTAVVVETVDLEKADKTLLVTRETGADGEPKYPSRNFIPLEAFIPQIKELLKDAKVGTEVVFPDFEGDKPKGYTVGMKVTVLGIYEMVDPKPAEEAPPASIAATETPAAS